MNNHIVKALGLLALLFLVSSPIKAQTHPCGGGPGPREVQVGEAPGGNGVAPMPMCNWVNGNQSQGSQGQPLHWVSQWGAIASYTPSGVLGLSTNLPNQKDAERLAMADCQAKSGRSNCKLEIAYHDQCVALVVGDSVYNTSSAVTIEKATQAGLQRCNGASSNCHVYYSACSLPKPIQ